MTDDRGFISVIKSVLHEGNLDEGSGILHLWHRGSKACGGRSHVGGVISLDPDKFSASEPEHRCKRCDARFHVLKSKFPNFGKPKTDEDAGLSADGIPANNAGGAQVDGIGIGPRGEPGGMTHRRKKLLAQARNPKLFADLARGGAKTIEMSHYKEDAVELNRYADEIDEDLAWSPRRGKNDGPVDTKPILPEHPKEIDADNSKRKKSKNQSKRSLRAADGSEILINPVIPTRFEDMDEGLPGGISRIDYLIRIGLPRQDAVKKINYYRVAIRDPEVAMKNATYREYVVEVLEKLLHLIFNDAQLYNRVRALLQKDDHTRGENELPEDLEDPKELQRFERWKANRVENEDAVTSTWRKVKGAADRRRPPGVSDEDWQRHLLAKHTGTVNDKLYVNGKRTNR